MCAMVLMMSMMPSITQAEEEPIRILLIGTDNENADASTRSDTMLLVQASKDATEIQMVSFLRDLYVSIPGYGNNRLNAAHSYGGASLVKQTIEENFGIAIDFTATADFSALVTIVDLLGGVDVMVESGEVNAFNQLLRSYNGSGPHQDDGTISQAGLYHMDGKQALSYSRIRKIDSDFERTKRQQKVLLSMVEQAKSLSFFEMAKLVTTVLSSIQTDIGLSDITRLMPLLTTTEELVFTTAQVPFVGTYRDETINGMMVLVPDLTKNVEQLDAFLNP